MRVAFLAPANSIHTARWVNGLVARDLDVHLISAHERASGIERRVHWHRLGRSAPWAYALCGSALAVQLRAISPDLLHAHYASGYGLLARLARFKPTLLSLWGSDVYDFPRTSLLHRWLLRGNLASATALASTSECMARRAMHIFNHPRVFVTPFGVDHERFAPMPGPRHTGQVVVGTVKTLTTTYGVDVLVEAFASARNRLGPTYDLRLEITGDGPEKEHLRRRVAELGMSDCTTFHGAIAHDQVPAMLRRLDIFVALSREESFGVAALEAAACERAIVVSDAEGLSEVVRNEETGLIVPRNDPHAAAGALCRLATDPTLRESLGRAARYHVLERYTWERSLDLMIDAYRRVVDTHRAQ
ncbi:MAG TPA: glycosyltransferase [Burkholderiaceae bacterium]|nr:glycosyltransferase [Burkholderiaceae bacterium]